MMTFLEDVLSDLSLKEVDALVENLQKVLTNMQIT